MGGGGRGECYIWQVQNGVCSTRLEPCKGSEVSQLLHSELLSARCSGGAGNAAAAYLCVWSCLLLLRRLRCLRLLLLLLLLLLREGEHHAHAEQLLLFLCLLLRLHS